MAENEHKEPSSLQPVATESSGTHPQAMSSAIEPSLESPETPDEISDDADDKADGGNNISGEDAESLIEPAMGPGATRLKLRDTPAEEKRNALEGDGGYLEAAPKTPLGGPTVGGEVDGTSARTLARHARANPSLRQARGLSLGSLLSELPDTLWHSGSKPISTQHAEHANSSMSTAIGGLDRKRSLSGSADALRKFLPKGLPSIAHVGNFFASSNAGQKPSSPLSEEAHPPPRPPRPPTLDPMPSSQTPGAQRPRLIRRTTSDDSLLYHSLSRASSLGDDTRFENQHDQVNSRVKAIRDSLQDRASFRLPQMPNILPGTVIKKPTAILHSVVGSKTNDSSTSGPEPATESARSGNEDSNTNALDRAMESLTGDIVIMGGYRGSILRSTKTNRQVWVPVKVGLNLRKVDLEVGLEPEDEERMSESIYASGMLQHIGPVDISRRLFKRLRECENARNGKLRVWDYGYDWRLSPHLLSKRLAEFLEKLPSNQPGSKQKGAVVIAHSLGGLITRHVVNQRPELFSGVIYAGVPQSCVNILGPIRNGDPVLLSSRVLTAQVNFTLRTSYLLLPEDGSNCFVDINTKEKYPVDFFDIDEWFKYRFSPCIDPPLPPRNSTGGLGGILNLSGSLLNIPIPGRKSISSIVSPHSSGSPDEENREQQQPPSKTTRAADILRDADQGRDRTLGPTMGTNTNPVNKGQSINSSVSTAVTIPRDKAIAYLRRTLAEVKKFKEELHFKPELAKLNLYPPLAVIYCKSIPTCCGAKVDGREGIACSDAYDNLAFASGDGVVLAREAMLPEGYKVAYGGRVKSDRGHVTLLGDLNAVGKALEAVIKGRAKGIGLGLAIESAA